MQDGRLFMGDICSNIIISAPWLTREEAWEAAEIAGLAEDIRAMPMGMNTLISEGLGSISGGQRQRLMIARAVAPKPGILMLDEATSALDNLTQQRIAESLGRMKCTRIVIAHRLSTQVAGAQQGPQAAIAGIGAVLLVIANRPAGLRGFQVATENSAGGNAGRPVEGDHEIKGATTIVPNAIVCYNRRKTA